MEAAYATLINTILTRIVFNHMTMFLAFLFSSFYFMPPELVADIDSKTPPFFPSWFPLSALGSVVITFIATAIWILLCNGVKAIYHHFRRSSKANSEEERLISLIPDLSELEKDILVLACLGERIWNDDFKVKVAIEKLLHLNLIHYSWVSNHYEINELIRPFIIKELDKSSKSHH
ncbi:hypothetical protein ACPEEL_04135 [Pasteurella sp. PK-2025]|uniref:hypothetical protein n=1 Tax=unclassified Pasteurella TaxID=2621516 RepID=UPI003C764FF1